MKIDRSKVKKVPGDAPADTKVLIQQITSALPDEALLATCLAELSPPKSWEVAKCELFHWSEILNKFDDILAKATETTEWTLACDRPGAEATKDLVMKILVFTGQLIEHSFSRHLYNSMDRLIALLDSDDMLLVQNVLTLLYTFSKRSSFLTRLREEITKGLFLRLQLLAETWGGKVNGFGLAKCCEDISLEQFPTTSTTVHFEFFSEQEVEDENGLKRSVTNIIHVENVDKMKPKTIPQIMNDLVREYSIPESKQIPLYFHLRLAYSFADYKARVFCVHSRLLSLAILAYTNHIPENLTSYIYSGIVEELVDVLQLKSHDLLELKAAVMRTLTAVVHHDRGSRCMDIIDATSSSSYHGFLPVLVRTCIQSLTESRLDDFPVAYATAVFSFLYHMASYESGGDALVACGMMESMLKVVNWYDTTEENITFVTRAVRVIDLITNIDMASFQNHNGLSIFTRRLEHEVEICRKAQPYVIRVQAMDSSQAGTANETDTAGGGEYESGSPPSLERTESGEKDEDKLLCFPQRAALLKSILNFLKKIIPDATFTDSIRHLMDGTLPSSLKHIISNADYYGHSLFLLATDIVTVYVFHEPAMLTSLQDRGLTDVILQAVLVKDLNANREVLSAIPNICSALCLNARGLQAFVACKPFEKLFKVLLSPGYLVAMRRRRNGEGHGDMAAGLGAAVDELMRHQPSLRTQAMQDIVKLLNQLCEIGRDSSNVCAMSGPVQQGISRQLRPDQSIPGESSDDEDEFEDSQQGGGISFPSVPSGLLLAGPSSTSASDIKEKLTVPLMDYIINVTKFVEAVLTSNSTDDHCREFIRQDGLKPLMEIFRLPNLPLEFPMMPACQAANALVKSVVAYCRDQPVLDEAFRHMDVVLKEIKEISKARLESGGSAILNEWAQCPPNIEDAIREPTNTPLLHRLSYMHSYIGMMTCICKLNQSDIKTLYTNAWATEIGIRLLHEIADLYGFLLWETTILQQLGSEDGLAANECDAARADLKVVLANRKGVTEEDATSLLPLSLSSSNLDAATPMDVDGDQPAAAAVTAGLATPKRMSVQEKIRLHSQLLTKFLRPATAMGMKLCRITTELLSLMVKFCVNPARPRRHAVGARGEVPSGHARSVATTISSLITQVINRKGPIANPSLRLRLQYLYYAMFMIQPLLFDEKRFAYHFMLQKFISTGTIDAFFGAFKPVLKGPTGDVELTGPNADKAAGCIVEFAISWLSLLERLLSPKNILESPNTLPISRIPISGYVAPFDPVPYYIEMLHSTLQVIDKLLSLQALKNFGEQTGDLLLTILSHVMKIEAIIKEKTVGTATAPVTSSDTTAASAAAAAAAGGASAAAAPPQPAAAAVPPAALQSLLDMGFTPEASAEALVYHANNVEQAADYLLAGQADRVMRAGGMRVLDMDADANEDELMSQAIAMSIGERLPGTGEASADGSAAALPRVPVLIAPSSQQIEALINRALPLCIDLVDFAPECVFKVADLITVISKRNGSDWRVKLIKTLAKDAVALATSVIQTADRFYSGEVQPPADTSAVDVLRAAPESLKLSARLHLLCILIQENQEECGAILESDSLVPLLISLISAARRIHGLAERGSELAPKWLAFAYLILDSYEKICAAARRRRLIREKYANTWRWLDVRLGKWTPYCDQNNREISEAYDKGLATCKLSGPGAGPQRSLVIRFKDMVQMTDATGSRRPIMRDLLKKPKTSETAAAALATDSLATEMPKNTDDKSPSARPPVLLATDNNGSPMQTDQDVPEEKVPVAAVAPATLNGLLPEQKRAIISDTVSLIHQKLDGDTLQAAMRILLRLTRDYEMAQLFAELKGPQILFGLDRRSMFESFTSFLTHLIRHIIENNSLLDYSMEKFCSWLTYGVVSSVAGTSFGCQAVREGNYVMRVAWPGAARHSEKFIECARKSLRLNTPTGSAAAAAARAEDPNQRADCVKPCPPKRNNSIGQEQPEAYCNILRQLIADLLDLLIAPWEPECKKVVLPAKDTSTKDSSPVTASATTSQRQQNNLQPLLQEQADELKRLGAGGSADSDQTLWKLSDKASRPVLKKSMVLRMLAELVKSYNHVATYILAHSYHADQSPLVKEDIGSLGFILDNFVHVGQKAGDDYCQYSARVLMAALAASFENVPAEMQVVEEVKQALQRATILPESQEKHERIGALANIIHTMVEACPTRVADPSGDRSIQFLPNTICKFMAKRNLINDLAKIPHSLDLRSPYLAATINFVLRPLEVLTRIASQPEKPKARPAKVGVGAVTSHAHTARTTTAGNADASDVTPMSGQDESQRTENDVAPIADDMNIAEGADLNDLYFMTPAMDVDTDNQQVTSEGEDDEPVQRPERRNRLRNNRELDISMEEDNSENEDDIQEQLRPSGGGVGGLIADEDPAEADEDEEMQDEEEDEDDEEDDEEEDEEEDEEDDFIEHAPLQHHHNHDGGEEFRGFPGYRAAFDGGDWGDDDHTFDEDMLAHLEDLFPGAALTHGLDPHGPLLLELTAGNGPGAIGQELQNGSTGTRQPPPPLAISSSHPLLARPPPVLDPSQLAPTTGGAAARLGMGHSDTAMNARGSRVMRIRSGQLTSRMGGGGGGHARMALGPPAILARLLGPAFQLYPGDPMAMMAGHGGAIRQGRHPAGEPATFWDHDYGTAGGTRLGEQEDLMLVDDPIFLGTNGLVNSLPSLVRRWSEEARVLDGENVIECADVVRAFILPELEEIRDASIAQNRKDNPEASVTTTPSTSTSQRHLQTARRSYRPSTASADGLGQRLAAAAAESSALQGDAASSHASILDDLSLIEESAGIAALGQAVAARMAQEMDQSDSDESEEDYSSHLSEDTDGDLPDAVIDMVRNRVLAADPMDLVEAPTDAGAVLAPPGDAAPPPTAADTAPAAAPTAEHPATAAADAATTPASAESVGVQPVIATPAADAPVPGQATMNATSAPGTSTATASSVDTGYPEGIDPSFLEALPENMRQEVIADFMRMQRQQRAAQEREARAAAGPAAATAATGTADSGVVSAAGSSAGTASASSAFDINPEFLAALPPNIQEEVLAQQRAEQARVAAQTAAPDAPFDPANFIQSLAPSLRRQILADIDDTLLTVLPDNVAQEARTLRNEVAHRHIFAHHGMPGGGGGAIGGAGGGAGMAFDGDVIAFMRGRFPTLRRGGAAPRPYSGNFATRGGAGGSRGLRIRSRTQNASRDGGWLNGGAPRSAWDYGGPLDAEGGALMRVGDIDCSSRVTSRPILDYEGLTCVLVLYFLNSPSINIGRVQRIFRNICHHASTREWVLDSVMSMLRKADESAAQGAKRVHTAAKPNWLNISIDAALGCRANVFQLVPRQLKRPHTLPAPGITIHPQAAQIVCGNLIDCLMLLAKNFPEQFVPYSIKTGDREKDTPTTRPPPKSPVRSAPRTPAGAGGSSRSSPQDFWDILVRLDTQVGCGVRKPVKASGKQVSAAGPMHVVELGPDEPLRMVEFAASGLGQLIMMLQSDIFQKIPDLSDRLLRLVSSIAISVHKRDLGVPVSKAAVTKASARTIIRPGKLTRKERDLVLWKAAITRFYSPDLVDLTIQPPLPIVETEGGDYTADLVDVSAALSDFLKKLDPACDANELKDQVSNLAVDLCNLSTPGAIRFSLTVESEQATEIEHLLRQLVNVLIARRCSEEGLEDITHTLIVLAQRMGTSVRQSIGQMLLDGIKQLAREVSGQIETLMREAVAYNAMKAREKAEEQDSESADATGESSAKGVLADRFTSGETVVLYKSKGKSQGSSEVHLPGMTQLTGKSSCQTFMLKLLKVIIDLRGTARISLRSKSGDKSDTCPNGTVNSIARRLLEMSYRHRQNKVRGISTDTPMDVDIPPLEGATPTPSASISGSSVAGTEEGSTAVTSDPESIRLGPGLAPPPPPRPGWVDSAALEIDLPALSELLNVEDLWTYLSACLGELERTGDQNAVLILQPTVESFFLVHAKEKQNADRREHATRRQAADVPPGNVAVEELAPAAGPGESASLAGEPGSLVGEQVAIPSDLPMDVQKFLRFAETHKVVLNQILRQSTQALTEGPFAVLVDHTRVLDFDVKRKYFRHELDRVDQHRMRREDLALRIRRAHVFEDSFRDLHRRVAEDWKARFYIMFEGEEGQDAGGLLREWYSIISRDIFNPNYALFKTSPGDRVTYMINSYSHINSNHLSYFKFVGRLIAKAIYDNKLLDCYFTRSFYKHILGKPVKYTDMESEDYSFYQGLVYLLNHPVEEVGSELSFSMEVQEFGETKVKDLIPNGEKIPVTNENKHDYVRLACQMRMTHSIREQLDSFLAGFYEVIPVRLISIFNEQELELLISGLPNIDVDDLKANTDYHKYQLTSLQIQWFWRAIRSFDQADRAKFLQFVTGTSKVPLQGFAALEGMSGAQKFQIHRDDRSTDRLPSAHTCFNQLDLPAYETYDKLRTMLSTAIHECSEGFGFA